MALDHLLGLLKDKRGALTRKLQAPLQKHLNHYLQLLFPAAHLEIDENLSPGPLTRNGPAGPESGAFEALSFGAREQMGVISRLAYADWTYPDSTDTTDCVFHYSGSMRMMLAGYGAGLSNGPACGQADGPAIRP